MSKLLPCLLPAMLGLSQACADVTLPPLISDNAVLQQGRAAVWGKADPGEKVTVTLGKTSARATAGPDGQWRVELKGLLPGEAGAMTVEGKNRLTVRNVAVGDVWFCSGQSNMEMHVAKGSWRKDGGVLDAESEIAAANHPLLRSFNVPRVSSETPVPELQGQWEVCTPQTVGRWTAVGYFFGRQLHRDLKIPVGLIKSAVGGTPAQEWTHTGILQGDPEFKAAYYDKRQAEIAAYPEMKAKYDKEFPEWQAAAEAAKAEGKPVPPKPRRPMGPGEGGASTLYNGMVHGATPFPIKGVIWYQGEANTGESDLYRRLLPAMIASWREEWGQADLPFYIVQLANFMKARPEPADSNWANLRDSQRLTAETIPHTGLAVAIDIGEGDNIHPANKQEVGRRLALAAEAQTYGKPVVASGPWFEAARFDGAKAILSFKPGTASRLTTLDGGPVHGFALAGEDRRFVWAEAAVVPAPGAGENTLVLSAPGVEKPVAVRYAWANNPAVNLVNRAGLPAVPFRTDRWPQEEPPVPAAIPAASPSPAAK